MAVRFVRPSLFAGARVALATIAGASLALGLGQTRVAPAPEGAEAVEPASATPAAPALQPRSLAGRLLFDEPGDGAIWALGGASYKARFDETGATYYPFFGSSTPNHFPLGLTLREVCVGGEPLEIDRAAACEREGNLVLYERGALVELYELGPTAMEQKFVFDRLPAVDDLLLRIAVETELACAETLDGFRFEGEYGSVGYTRAVVVDASGDVSAASTTFADGVVEIRVPSELLLGAAWPITIDPVVTTFPIDTDPAVDAFAPDVAYDETTDRYNVVWEQAFNAIDHDVYSQLWTSGGTLVGGSEVAIDFTTSCCQNPQVANNQIADQFLTVFQQSSDCSGFPTTVFGRTRQAANNDTGSAFVIDALLPGDNINPDVGGDAATVGPTYYCVVWQNQLLPSSSILYQLVRSDGTLLWDLPVRIDPAFGNFDTIPSVSKSNGPPSGASQDWNVVWQRSAAPGNEDIQGAQIHRDGSITTASFAVDAANANDRNPQASSLVDSDGAAPGKYLVVYQRGPGAPHDIQGRVLVGSIPLTASTNLTDLEDGTHQPRDQVRPATDTDGACFGVAYAEQVGIGFSNFDVYVSTFAEEQGALVATESHENLASSMDEEDRPELTAVQSGTDGTPVSPNRFMAVWDVGSSPARDIEGGLYDTACPPGIALCFGDGSGTPCPCGNNDGPGSGCRNTSGSGCRLFGSGSNSISAGDLVLSVTDALPGQPGLFFQGDNAINGGNGFQFGDGLRCCGGNAIRLEVRFPDGSGSASTTLDIAAAGGVSPGDIRCYQFWYRDPPGVCGFGFNLSNAYEVTWAP